MKWVVVALIGGAVLGVSADRLIGSGEREATAIARSLASSVQLFAEREGGVRRTASGIALAVDRDGTTLILTAGHFLAPSASQTVYVARPGGAERVEARVLAIDSDVDLALVEADAIDVAPVELQTGARLGDDVWVVSFPWGRRGTLVSGVVSQVGEDAHDSFPLEGPVGLIDAAVSYGTSGGGVFDADTGRLVGIVRGYRTARLTLPGTPAQSLEFPIAGETTVVPTPSILCALSKAPFADRIEPVRSAAFAPHGPCGGA